MKKLTKQQKEEIIKKIQEDKPVPDEYRFLVPFETEREYELTYAGKERKEDILADTLSVPFQPIKKFSKVKENEWHNMLIFGDNLQALKHLLKLKEQGRLRNPDGTNGVKLVYIDPPFGTGDIYDAAPGMPAYSAKMKGVEFLESLRKRLLFISNLLTDDGSLFIRIDYHYGHYVKAIMDEIFEKNNFRNEIIVNRGQSKAGFFKQFEKINSLGVAYDTLFWYSKDGETRFPKITKEAPKEDKENGKWMNLIKAKAYERPTMTYEIMGVKKDAPWMWKKERSFLAIDNYNNFLKISKHTGESLEKYWVRSGKKLEFVRKNANQIQYWIPPRDKMLVDNNWLDIKGYSHITDYPTENSEELLERVLQVTSKGDIVLDCYAGSGTTGVVAEKLDRKWIMCDAGKLAIYTMQKRLLNLKAEIGNKGKSLKPKPFVLYNAGLYQDSGFIEKMDEADYKKFVLELFSTEPSEHQIKGVQMHGILNNQPVMVFSQKNFLTYEFIDDLHKIVGSGLKDEMHIIVPQSVVRFNEDYVDKGKIRYHILKVPYSIIQKILEKNFTRGIQPLSKADINQTIESVGFDFIYPPKVECEYYQSKENTLFDNLVIKIRKFEPVQISKNPVEFQDPKKEALSMVMIDEDYDGKVFDMDYYFFGDEIAKKDFKAVFPNQKAGEKIMVIYLDVLGNENVEVKDIKDFKKK